jgi:hypothetical protein
MPKGTVDVGFKTVQSVLLNEIDSEPAKAKTVSVLP